MTFGAPSSNAKPYELGKPSVPLATGGRGVIPSELQSLLDACGVYPLEGRAQIALSGEDRVRWLNGVISNNVRDLQPGQGVYAFLLNPQGRILADLYAYNRASSLVVDTTEPQLAKVREIFERYIIMDDVEVRELGGERRGIGIAGPRAQDVLRSAGVEVPALGPLDFVDLSNPDPGLTLVRSDNRSLESYELWLLPESFPVFWEKLVKSGATPVGERSLEAIRIAAGIPRYGVDIRERELPQETGQTRALHFAKGCYIGQEIVERIRSRGNVHRLFTGFEVFGALAALPTKIVEDGKEVGEITSAISLPFAAGERNLALGYLRREFSQPGTQLDASGVRLSVTPIPFSSVFAAQGKSHV